MNKNIVKFIPAIIMVQLLAMACLTYVNLINV